MYSYDRSMTAASEIPVDQLPPDRLALLDKLGLSPKYAFKGYIATCKNRWIPRTRLDKDVLKMLVSFSTFRWIEVSDDEVSIGF